MKKSRQRIDAPKDSCQVSISDGYKNGSPLFSDQTTISVVFPDLAGGDTTVFSSRVTNSEGMFPNRISTFRGLSPFAAPDDSSIEIIATAAMSLKTRSYFLDERTLEMKEGKQNRDRRRRSPRSLSRSRQQDGDCKDHAALLQALLASRNIVSEQALIDAGWSCQLPDVPVVSAVNHVINYIPEMNLFLDATSSDTPFAMLPMNLGEKPVILVAHYREGMKTPSTAPYGHEQSMRTAVTIPSDGSATGDIEMSLKGMPAVVARSFMRAAPSGQEEFMAERMPEAQRMHGKGTLKKDDPAPLLDTCRLGMPFSLQDCLTVGSATGLPVEPVVGSSPPLEHFLASAFVPESKKPQACSGEKALKSMCWNSRTS